MSKHTLNTLDEIKQYFANNPTPYYFISASNFNLMSLSQWVAHWQHINLIDCYDGQHPDVMLVTDSHDQLFTGIEDINLYLLNQESVAAHIAEQNPPGKAIFLFFDEQIEARCEALGLEIILPKNSLVKEIDSKIVTTEIGNQVNVPSVPNILAKVDSYETLLQLAKQASLGQSWVIQTAYGDSGKTTFFVDNEEDYQRYAHKIEAEDTVKVMRKIHCIGTAIEACATRWGTFVGPLLTEVIGDPALTPYAGGWCGNELYQSAFSDEIRLQVQRKAERIGNALYQRGYRGYFELDFLLDMDTAEVYLGELNARITGISAMTNQSDFSEAYLPLFLMHLLEYDTEVELTLSAAEFNQQMLAEGAQGIASQMVLKYTEHPLQIIEQAPVSGVYTLVDGRLQLTQASYHRRDALADNQAFIMRIAKPQDYAYHGGDLAIIFINQTIRHDSGKLDDNGLQWVKALKQCFTFRPLTQQERSEFEQIHNPANVKSSRESGAEEAL